MIKYSLICDKEHTFEGWFSSSENFDAQKTRDLVTCPFCNSSKIEKTLMTPSVSTSKRKTAKVKTTGAPPHQPDSSTDSLLTTNADVPAGFTEMMTKMRELRDHIQANAENVGSKFSEEARKIHYGESEKRGIYGQASVEDVKGLIDEGIEVMPLPVLPEDRN